MDGSSWLQKYPDYLLVFHSWFTRKFTSVMNYIQFKVRSKTSYPNYTGYIDVGDGCWRPNVLMTNLRISWPIQDAGDRLKKSPT